MGNLQENWNEELFRNDIKRIVSRISRIDVSELDDRLLVREELGIDSLMAMEIIATCEKLLGLKIDETLFADIQTVGDFLDLLVTLSGRVNA
jgi:acyl carrier protein